MTKIIIPLNAFKAVQKAQSKDKIRYHLGGVYVENETLVATNGHILLRYALGDDATGIAEPVILYVDPYEKAMKPKHSDHVFMHVDLDRKIVETFYRNPTTKEYGERLGVCACVVVDGRFPEYKRVIPDNTKTQDLIEIAFDAAYVADFAASAKIMGVKPVLRFVSGPSDMSPANVIFGGVPQLEGVIMPHKL